MLLAFPIARIFRLSKNGLRTLFLVLPFGNIAYLGMPILQNAFGDEILPVAAVISSIYVFWLFTLGIVLVEIYGEEKLRTKKLFLNLLQNPLLISVLIGLVVVHFQIKLPVFVAKTIQLFADSVTAVVLFSLGIFLWMQKMGNVRLWFRVVVLTVFTMLVLPFVFFQALSFASFDPLLTKISVIDSAMPLGLTPYALTVVYKLESNLAARIVVFGTLLSMLLIPLWMVWLE
jgi:predicted permease